MEIEILSPDDVVKALNAGGCSINVADYKALICACATVPHQGTEERGKERVGDNAGGHHFIVPSHSATGKALHRDRPYKAEHVVAAKQLRSSVESHLNQSAACNRWFIDPPMADPAS